MFWQVPGNLNISETDDGYWLKETLCGECSEVISPKQICSETLSINLSTDLCKLPTHLHLYL